MKYLYGYHRSWKYFVKELFGFTGGKFTRDMEGVTKVKEVLVKIDFQVVRLLDPCFKGSGFKTTFTPVTNCEERTAR